MTNFVYQARDTLFTTLLDTADRFGRRAPARWEDMKPGSYSYGELIKMTLALGRLSSKVSEPGEHIGVLMPNLTATVALLIGLSAFRRVPCMLNYSAGADAMRNACEAAGVHTVITSRVFLDKAGLVEQVASLRGLRLVYLEDLRKQFSLADKLWLIAFALPFPRRAVPRGDPEAPAVVLFTSGSEGKPKGVVLSHRALLANVAQVMHIFPFGPDDTILNTLPIFHSFGLTAGTLIALVSGARLVLYTSPLHFKVIPELVREKRCTVMFGTSTFLHHYARNAGAEDFKSMKIVVAGAEKLAESVRKTWLDRFDIEIYEGYGATETAPVLAVNYPGRCRPGTVGQLLPGIEARLFPVEGIERGGELHVRGPNLMSGYYRFDTPALLEPPASNAGAGWHDTGDVAELDADGYLSILGRLKRFAKVAGEMVSLEVVESIARAASGEAAHAAISVSDPARGEAIILFTTDAVLSRDRLAAMARSLGHPEIALPRRIQVITELPTLGTGKIDYMRLKESASAL
jgi:acyl-[acyl-carrier-protein]-phospholipid O-acyltransferase/long-chain-fatty-acid--[acyl-carrier-protein] ligase